MGHPVLAVAALRCHERELGVAQDVVVCPAHAMLGGPEKQVPVVGATLPPDGQVGMGVAELQAGAQLRVAQGLLPHFPQQLDAVQGARSALLCDGLDEDARVHQFYVRAEPRW